ncbi:MAG TPA: hypothetical protein VGF17_04600, partial [Phytomonospora sp.]
EETRPFTPPLPQGGYGGPPPQQSPYGPPHGQQPYGAPGQNLPPLPGQGGSNKSSGGGVSGLVDTVKKNPKPWLLSAGAAVVVIVLVFVMIGVLGGGGDEDPGGATPTGNGENTAIDTEVYTDEVSGYTVNVPKGWSVEPGNKKEINVYSPADQEQDTWIRFNVTEGGGTPEAFLTGAAKGLDGGYFKKGSLEQISLGPVSFGGHDGSVIEYTGTRKNDEAARHGLWAVIQVDDLKYHIYLSVPEESFADNKAVFDEAVESFQLAG